MEAQAKELASQWLAFDWVNDTRTEVEDQLKNEDWEAIIKNNVPRIGFGTAGLRSRMAAGYANMNALVVRQTSQGLAHYVAANVENAKTRGIIVGYDGRYNSKAFATLTCDVFASLGFKCYLFNRIVATPLVPFGLLHLNCACGVMVTASHNPKADNGYKVYWANGAQIIPPHDEGIAASILSHLKPEEIAITAEGDAAEDCTDAVVQAYYDAIHASCCYTEAVNPTATVPIVFTAMHGVGKEWIARMSEKFALPPFINVPSQIEADPEFPTVTFPNPEEGKGALKLAMETADAHNANVLIANDPDSDRLAAAERQANGEWRIFNGNEMALLMAAWIVEQERKRGRDFSKAVMIASTVSSKVLRAMADAEGFLFDETLTGFKWMGNQAITRTAANFHVLFAYEVEIGFMPGPCSFDKDGVRAAGLWAEMTHALYGQNETLNGKLEALYAKYGYFVMNTRYFFCDGTAQDKVFHRLRHWDDESSSTISYPTQIGEYTIASIRDLTRGYDSAQPDQKALLPTTKDHMITFTFTNGGVCTFRPSGTEPKLKYYFEVVSKESKADALELLEKMKNVLLEELLQPSKFGLIPPKE